eukprot:scaffold157617_cov23-Cyclotella_meneghiniana.AAC.1
MESIPPTQRHEFGYYDFVMWHATNNVNNSTTASAWHGGSNDAPKISVEPVYDGEGSSSYIGRNLQKIMKQPLQDFFVE